LHVVTFELFENIQYDLRSKSKDTAVHQKKIKSDEKDRSADSIVLHESCSDHSQEWKVLYLSIDRSRTMIFYHNRNRTYEFDTSILSWLEPRKHRTRCLSIFYSQTLISLFIKSRTSRRRMSRRIRSLIRLRRSSQRHRRICEIWWHIAKRNRQRSILNENLSDDVMIWLCEEDIEEHVS